MGSYLTKYMKAGAIEKTIDMAKNTLRGVDFDTFAVTGTSGLVIGAPLSVALAKNLIVIRKTLKNTHSSEIVEGWGVNQKIILVDDIIFEGGTIERMYDMIEVHCQNPTIVGMFLYEPCIRKYYRLSRGTVVPLYTSSYQWD